MILAETILDVRFRKERKTSKLISRLILISDLRHNSHRNTISFSTTSQTKFFNSLELVNFQIYRIAKFHLED